MQRSIRATMVAAVLLLGAADACRDAALSPTEPQSPVRTGRHGRAASQLVRVGVIHRSTALATDVSWSFVAGPLGAVSLNPDVGLTVSVPAGALSTTQTITVTALAGSEVAYRFEPHLSFDRAVTLTQDLTSTDAATLSVLLGAHFDGDHLELINGLAVVTETVPAVVSLLQHSASFDLAHFSGWIVASGRDDDGDSTVTSLPGGSY